MEKKLSHSEAVRLGYLKSKDKLQKIAQKYIDDYNKNPKLCLYCGTPIPYEKRRDKFCNHHCSGFYHAKPTNRTKNIKKENPTMQCLLCGAPLKKNASKFCSSKYCGEYIWKQHKKEIEVNGKFPSKPQGDTNLQIVRKYLIEKYGNKCMICGLETWQGKPIPLVADHIDGNPYNHKIENFRMICCNCDALTDTYKSKNKGKDRVSRRLSYHKLKNRILTE